jgi:hypothetical protein
MLHATSPVHDYLSSVSIPSLREQLKGLTAVNRADGKMSGPSAQHGAREG